MLSTGNNEYFKHTEAMLYEYYTLEIAMPILERKKDIDKLEEKRRLKKDIEDAISTLSKTDKDFLEHVYNNPESNVELIQNIFCMSQATYYRTKRRIVKQLAMCLGLK